jgi:hypothetical protein
MAVSSFSCRGRYWLTAFVCLLASLSIVGCNPQALNFLLMPFVDDKQQPECKLTSPDKKEVTVAIVSTFAGLETRPEMMTIDSELSERLTFNMRKLAKETKEKITFVPNSKVRNLLSQEASATMSRQEIGKKLKADYVISLEIREISLYGKGSANTLFCGKTAIDVSCIDVRKSSDEADCFSRPYSREYPRAHHLAVGDTSLVEFRALFVNTIAQEIAQYFVAFPDNARSRMD